MTGLEDQAGRRAWLVLLKTDYRRLGNENKYDDDAATHYSWDSRVPNWRQVRAGDVIAVWDEAELIGISVIEAIKPGRGNKPIARCPNCERTNIERRTTMSPTYRCYNCKATFEEPEYEETEVDTFRSDHGQSWVELPGSLTAGELRALCVMPKSQNSIRELRWNDFAMAIRSSGLGDPLTPLEATAAQLIGGHITRPVRVRLGQNSFRAALLRKFGAECVFSGPVPEPALEACHLYSYATVGQHDPHGGVLLRRDLHSLFDRGLIAVDGADAIDVCPDVRSYPLYGELHGRPFGIKPNPKQREWLRLHWQEFRAG
ncbi:HNH endonuclease signature motif containing protein [Nocardia australiensis]|uniref:HNH endonuclease signature motif containing protein n=1 Tax=Nocardia australiensis TaxID=2887191 RepID=UPI001D13F613|nr:HNH endonuclease signature motif containing protein [Nocardia australiensis]